MAKRIYIRTASGTKVIFTDKADADNIAGLNNRDETDGWSYEVEEAKTEAGEHLGWVVEIYDDENFFVGCI